MARQPKDLEPERSQAHRLGAELRRWRVRRGLSQDRLGVAICHSGALVSKIERAERAASLVFCRGADAVLDTGGVLARLWVAAATENPAQDGPLDAIGRLRRALGLLGVGRGDGAVRDLDALAVDVARANDHRLQARYTALGEMVPELIGDLADAELSAHDGAARRRVSSLLALALRAADGLAFKLGHLDMSARLIDLMTARALAGEDPTLLAAAGYVRTETHFATGDLAAAHRGLVTAIDRAPAPTDPGTRAAVGALHMRAAVVSARRGRSDDAAGHLASARRAADGTPEGVYQGTAFGPASLRIHELAVAAELRDAAGVQRATRWRPPPGIPAERRSHYFIELSRAQLELGHHAGSCACLLVARQVAPQHTRAHPQVRRTVAALLRTGAHPGLGDLASWVRVR